MMLKDSQEVKQLLQTREALWNSFSWAEAKLAFWATVYNNLTSIINDKRHGREEQN